MAGETLSGFPGPPLTFLLVYSITSSHVFSSNLLRTPHLQTLGQKDQPLLFHPDPFTQAVQERAFLNRVLPNHGYLGCPAGGTTQGRTAEATEQWGTPKILSDMQVSVVPKTSQHLP